jgi:hypothetical protein
MAADAGPWLRTRSQGGPTRVPSGVADHRDAVLQA